VFTDHPFPPLFNDFAENVVHLFTSIVSLPAMKTITTTTTTARMPIKFRSWNEENSIQTLASQ
jgi:hypothetical protein